MRGMNYSSTSLFSLLKQLFQRSFVCLWDAEGLQDLIGRTIQLHIMLHDGNLTIGNDSLEYLDFQMLFQPHEKIMRSFS